MPPLHTLFLDTHVLVRVAAEPPRVEAVQHYIASQGYTLAVGSLNFTELYQHESRWEEVAEFIASVPFCIVENIEKVTEREVLNYPSATTLLAEFSSVDAGLTRDELKHAIQANLGGKVAEFDRNYRAAAPFIHQALQQDKQGFFSPEHGQRYSSWQRDAFLWKGVFQALSPEYLGLLQAYIEKGEAIDVTRFASVYVQQLAIFLEYYEQNKPGKVSDIGDFTFLGYLPYVDEAVLDKERAHVVRRINQVGGLGQQLPALTLKQFLSAVGAV
jgi:hypothetical protein